jgi:hypothetical protein
MTKQYINKESTENIQILDPMSNVTKELVNNEETENNDKNTEDIRSYRQQLEALPNKIRLVDKDEEMKLDLFCYISCTDEDEDLIKNARGIVFNEEKLVLKGYSYTTEYNSINNENIEKLNENINFKDYDCYDSYEGTLIRLFYYQTNNNSEPNTKNGKWYLSTHRKLDAYKSKWASRESFGNIFERSLVKRVKENKEFHNFIYPSGESKKELKEELKKELKEELKEELKKELKEELKEEYKYENIIKDFEEKLDKNKQYMFLLKNNKDNRIVCTINENDDNTQVYHVGTFIDGKLDLSENINLEYPPKHNFNSMKELIKYISEMDYMKLQGIICFNTKNSKHFKILHPEYIELFKARGNEPSIKFRYLQVRMNKKSTKILYFLYPDFKTVFEEYENTIYDIGRSIYSSYVQRFIKKRYVTVPKEEFQVIRDCHTWHLESRGDNRINLNQVLKILNQQTPTNLNHMIRRYRTEQIKKTDQMQNRIRINSKDSPFLTVSCTEGTTDCSPYKIKMLTQLQPPLLNLPEPILKEEQRPLYMKGRPRLLGKK